MESTVFFDDCLVNMKNYSDKCFDLAVVDPEFGIGIGNSPRLVTDKGLVAKDWDNKPITMEYFDELFRISKNQIIWGGNYYPLPATKHCIIWDKQQPEKLSFGMFDFAWTSFEVANKIFRYSVQLEKNKIHPTQKPVQLYSWIYRKYLPEGGKVIDTHLGSGSNRIAAFKTQNIDFTAYENDAEYYERQEKRFREFKQQLVLW